MNYFTCERVSSESNAGSKARNDVARIISDMTGWSPIELHRCWDVGSVFDKIRSVGVNQSDWRRVARTVNKNDVLLVQYPLAMYPRIARLAARSIRSLRGRGVKIVLFIHDLDSLRGVSANNDDLFLGLADVVVAHNASMRAWLSGRTSAPIVELGIFDYLPSEQSVQVGRPDGIDVAGNLSREKAGYLYEAARELPDIPFNLYGPNFSGGDGNGWYRGSFNPEDLECHMTGEFGLVWDGDSLSTCSGSYGKYLELNSPHKLSLYLALGKPVFIWEKAAEAGFVKENGVGYVVGSIYETAEVYRSLSSEERKRVSANARVMSERLRAGFYTKAALDAALQALGASAL